MTKIIFSVNLVLNMPQAVSFSAKCSAKMKFRAGMITGKPVALSYNKHRDATSVFRLAPGFR